jgi:hypothetical protein
MKLSQYRETYYFFSGKTSDISRQLAFAGIALVWIFKQEKQTPVIPDSLILPSILLVFSLAADLLQYFIASSTWGIFQRYHETKLIKKTDDPDLTTPRYFNWPMLTLYLLKILSVIIAYIFIIKFLASKLF